MIRERISGGNLLTGSSASHKEGINLRTSCAVVSRLSIYATRRGQTPSRPFDAYSPPIPEMARRG